MTLRPCQRRDEIVLAINPRQLTSANPHHIRAWANPISQKCPREASFRGAPPRLVESHAHPAGPLSSVSQIGTESGTTRGNLLSAIVADDQPTNTTTGSVVAVASRRAAVLNARDQS